MLTHPDLTAPQAPEVVPWRALLTHPEATGHSKCSSVGGRDSRCRSWTNGGYTAARIRNTGCYDGNGKEGPGQTLQVLHAGVDAMRVPS